MAGTTKFSNTNGRVLLSRGRHRSLYGVLQALSSQCPFGHLEIFKTIALDGLNSLFPEFIDLNFVDEPRMVYFC